MKAKLLLVVLISIGLIVTGVIAYSLLRQQRQWTLSEAAVAGDLATVQRCVDAGVDLDAYPTAENGAVHSLPALTCAALYGHEDVVRYLLNHGAHSNRRGSSDALIEACWKHQYDIAKLLLEHGANPNSRGEGTPLLAAEEQPELIELLHKYGAKEWNPQQQ